MNNKQFKVLAIESSCDETAASVVGLNRNGNPEILSNVVSSQVNLHAKTGGVVPEVASRAHMESIIPVVTEALLKTKGIDNCTDYQAAIEILRKEVDFIAVTAGPGLIGSLLVGFNAAKTLSYALKKPIIPINHIEGHIYSAFNSDTPGADSNSPNFGINFPVLTLTVSGGHSSLNLMNDHGKYQLIGETLDDAAGEAFDKVAKLLSLGYPGGPIVSKYASRFREQFQNGKQKIGIQFPRPILNDGTFNFSFSGLKTAVLQKVIELKKQFGENLPDEIKEEISAAFEDAAVDVLVTKTVRAIEKFKPKSVILAGGVAANSHLRENLSHSLSELNIPLFVPPLKYCGDNAAMIATAAFYHVKREDYTTWDKIKVDSNLELNNS